MADFRIVYYQPSAGRGNEPGRTVVEMPTVKAGIEALRDQPLIAGAYRGDLERAARLGGGRTAWLLVAQRKLGGALVVIEAKSQKIFGLNGEGAGS